MVEFFFQHQVAISILGTLVTVGGAGFGVISWLIFRNKPLRIEVANPEALTPPPRANLIEMTQREFIALTKEWRDQAYAERDKTHGAERTVLEDKIADLNRQLVDPEEALAQLHAKILRLEETLDGLGNNISSDRITAAKAAMEQGDFSLADALFAEVEAREELAVQNTARAAFGRGEVAEAEIRWPDAATHYARAATLAPNFERLYKATDFAVNAGRYDQADRFATDLVASARRSESPQNLSLALDRLATVFHRKGNLTTAEALFSEALEIARTKLGEVHPAFAIRLNNLALLVQAQGRYAEAERLFRQALDIGRATLGEAHPAYAIRLSNLAGAIKAQGRYAEAEPLYRQALDIGRATLGEAHPAYAIRLSNLAGVVEAQGRYAEAEPFYRQALDIGRATLGEAHPVYAILLGNLAGVVQAQGRYAEAEALFRQAIDIARTTPGEGHPDYATHLNNLAGVVQAQGRFADAEPLYRQALDVGRATIGEGHPDYAIRLVNLASCLTAQGKPEQARAPLDQALAIFLATLPADHPQIAKTLRRIAVLPGP